MKALLLGEPKNREYLESVAFGTQQIVALDPPLRGHPVVVMSSVRFSSPVGEIETQVKEVRQPRSRGQVDVLFLVEQL